MPHALLLSPDDQAVSAITGVLEEMSVTCERPLDGVSAAQKLNSHSFDLVLVDCENLPAAKLIFDVCRRGKNNNNPVPIAIVDGRAGLPTAFRLGAELILTKPVAKDQARSTIRTAVGRVRKDVQTTEGVLPQAASTARNEERTQSAITASVSSQLTNFADPAPTYVSNAGAGNMSSASAVAAPRLTIPDSNVKLHSSAEECDAGAPVRYGSPASAPFSPSSLSKSNSSSNGSVSPSLEDSNELSDDPVMAELEKAELEERDPKEMGLISKPDHSAPDHSAAESGPALFSSYQPGQQRTRGSLIALLMLALALGGFYALWTYQPGFRDIAQPLIDRVLGLAGMAHQSRTLPVPASNPAQPSAQMAPITTTLATASPNLNDQKSAPDVATSSAASSPTALSATSATSATTSAAAGAPAQPASTPSTTITLSTAAATGAVPVGNKPAVGNKDDVAALSSSSSADAQLPGESSAIILSSKGAEKRLTRSVQPKYPADDRSGDAQGTVVLKAVVDENGQVAGLRLVEGNSQLATAAIQAVKQWRYRPYVRDGKALPFQTVVIVDFQRP